MKFKIDENLPTDTADFFRSSGYDAETVFSESMQGCSDQFLIQKCREESRVLITLDTHFSNIIAYPPEKNDGILVLRVRDQSKETILKTVAELLSGVNRRAYSWSALDS